MGWFNLEDIPVPDETRTVLVARGDNGRWVAI